MAHSCEPSLRDALEAPRRETQELSTTLGLRVNSRPAWSTQQVPEQPGLHRETLSQTNKKLLQGGGDNELKRSNQPGLGSMKGGDEPQGPVHAKPRIYH